MNDKPPVLINSSVEGLEIAFAIQFNLDRSCACQVWNQGLFKLGRSNIENIIAGARVNGFAIVAITADDVKTRRGESGHSPSDNVILELGLLIGILGLDRTFIVYDRDANPMLPSDLDGVGIATYSLEGHSDKRAALGAACTEIAELIRNSLAVDRPPRLKIV